MGLKGSFCVVSILGSALVFFFVLLLEKAETLNILEVDFENRSILELNLASGLFESCSGTAKRSTALEEVFGRCCSLFRSFRTVSLIWLSETTGAVTDRRGVILPVSG